MREGGVEEKMRFKVSGNLLSEEEGGLLEALPLGERPPRASLMPSPVGLAR